MEVKSISEQKKEWLEFLMTHYAEGKTWDQFLHSYFNMYCRPSLLGE